MCGIVGMVAAGNTGFSLNEERSFQDMLYVDTLRGVDSTGVFGVTNAGNVYILKEASPGPEFIQTNEFKSFQRSMYGNGKFKVGHNRAATRGSITDKNAHPFVIEDRIVLVQNGTYKGSHKHIADTDVDTEAVAMMLAREADISKALKQINAAYALVWYDVPNRTMRMIRNNERPLFIGHTEGGGYIFASEYGSIIFAALRNNLKLTGNPEMLKENTLGTFELGERSVKAHFGKIDNTYVSPPSSTNFRGPNDWYGGDVEDMVCGYGPFGRAAEADDNVEPARTVLQRHMQQTGRVISRDGIEQLATEVLRYNDKDNVYTSEEANALEVEYNKDKNETSFVVEVFDYGHANSHSQCSRFWIFAKEYVDPQEEDQRRPIFYWSMENAGEHDALSEAGKAYVVKIDYTTKSLIKAGESGYHLCVRVKSKESLFDKAAEVAVNSEQVH